MRTVLELVDQIESEMRRLGMWGSAEPAVDSNAPYGGLSFEDWLRVVYLPAVRAFGSGGARTLIPPVHVGVAALRNLDYHSYVPGSLPLIQLCQELEDVLRR